VKVEGSEVVVVEAIVDTGLFVTSLYTFKELATILTPPCFTYNPPLEMV
jgi:hypoxanthine-guanine phosphoribosyltransferase